MKRLEKEKNKLTLLERSKQIENDKYQSYLEELNNYIEANSHLLLELREDIHSFVKRKKRFEATGNRFVVACIGIAIMINLLSAYEINTYGQWSPELSKFASLLYFAAIISFIPLLVVTSKMRNSLSLEEKLVFDELDKQGVPFDDVYLEKKEDHVFKAIERISDLLQTTPDSSKQHENAPDQASLI